MNFFLTQGHIELGIDTPPAVFIRSHPNVMGALLTIREYYTIVFLANRASFFKKKMEYFEFLTWESV